MFLRALLAFVILPGLAAFGAPLLIVWLDRFRAGIWWPGAIVAAGGTMVLIWCVIDFYRAGKGTLAPWDPPQELVVIGLYRWLRNPMYVGVVILILGWALLFQSWLMLIYTLVLSMAFHIRVVYHEEPSLASRFPQIWQAYRSGTAMDTEAASLAPVLGTVPPGTVPVPTDH